MATATLIDTGTPGPALALTVGTQSTIPTTPAQQSTGAVVTPGNGTLTAQTISLTAGTWAVVGVIIQQLGTANTTTPFLNLTGNTGSDSWAAKLVNGAGVASVKSAIIKLTVTTTIYLNATGTVAGDSVYGQLYAVQIK